MPELTPVPAGPEDAPVQVRRLIVTFDRPEVLEQIATHLLSKGLISGYKHSPVEAGYLHNGKQVQEGQHALRIFLPESKSAAEVRTYAASIIRQYWDVEDIEEDEATVPASMLYFMQKAGDEQRKHMRIKRTNKIIVWTSATLLLILAGAGVKLHSDASRAEGQLEGQREALRGAHDELNGLDGKMEQEFFGVPNGLTTRFQGTYQPLPQGPDGMKRSGWIIPAKPEDLQGENPVPVQIWIVTDDMRAAVKKARTKLEAAEGK
jgi:hypothetical protein